jgi:hypothetical protein
MKSIILFFFAVYNFSSWLGQLNQKIHYASINFLNHINIEYIDVTTANIKKETTEYKVVLPYYEYSVSDLKIGDACLYAISKEYPETLVKDAINNTQGICDQKGNYYKSFYTSCEAKRLFSVDTSRREKLLDLYVFLLIGKI